MAFRAQHPIPVLRIFDVTRAELSAKDYGYLRPGLDRTEEGIGVTLRDPFGNELRIEHRT